MYAIARATQRQRYRLTPGAPTCLTPQERRLLHHVARGWSNKQIATAQCIEPKTVSNRISQLCAKLHLCDRTAAALYYWGSVLTLVVYHIALMREQFPDVVEIVPRLRDIFSCMV